MSAPGEAGGEPVSGLAGARAVVTGGGSGIGLAIARRLRALGARLCLVGRDRARLERALTEIGGDGDQAIACDVTREDDVVRAFRTICAHPDGLQILVNNAGAAASARFVDATERMWDEMLRVNLGGVVRCTRAALPALLAAPFGRVVNVASTAGLTGYAYVTAYCAAKHAVIGLTRALAVELARTRVTVNAVCPGYTDTDMLARTLASIVTTTRRTPEEAREALLRRNPQHRFVPPDEVAETVAFLCRRDAQSVTGQAISISGGEVMK
ncbi:MAG: SDR family NAD(P)-dependent oxidoreductase [Rudaea sp.]